jgi:hypothetical protein
LNKLPPSSYSDNQLTRFNLNKFCKKKKKIHLINQWLNQTIYLIIHNFSNYFSWIPIIISRENTYLWTPKLHQIRENKCFYSHPPPSHELLSVTQTFRWWRSKMFWVVYLSGMLRKIHIVKVEVQVLFVVC